MKWLNILKTGTLLLICIFFSNALSAQNRVVQEYKIQNLISDVLLQKFEQINPEIQVYEHKEGNRLILVGDSEQIEEAIVQLEMLDTQQMMVTIEFLLLEYFHEKDFEWGIDITQGTTGNFSDINYTPSAQGGDVGFSFNSIANLAPAFHVNVRALVARDRAKILTNPHLAVESGEQASLNIKDRRTVTLETSTINGVTTTLQTVEAGIEMYVTPTPTHDSLIHLDIQGTVSEFLPFSAEGEFLIEENYINTKVDVYHGQTLIMGGLIIETTNDLDGGFPILKDIPLLGFLFKKKQKINNYVERVIYITPYLHPLGEQPDYRQLRERDPYQKEIEQLIETDPDFLKYRDTEKVKRRKRQNNSNDNEPKEELP